MINPQITGGAPGRAGAERKPTAASRPDQWDGVRRIRASTTHSARPVSFPQGAARSQAAGGAAAPRRRASGRE